MIAALLLAAVCTATNLTPVLVWNQEPVEIEQGLVQGHRVYYRLNLNDPWILAADRPCWVESWEDDFGNRFSFNVCAGVGRLRDMRDFFLDCDIRTDPNCRRAAVPAQRHVSHATGYEIQLSVTAYNDNGESAHSDPVTLCWPETWEINP